MRVALLLLFVLGCGPKAGWEPDLPVRDLFDYPCSDNSQCRDNQGCYKRYPVSQGRCVHREYYETHPRGCSVDAECRTRETCRHVAGERFGVCTGTFD